MAVIPILNEAGQWLADTSLSQNMRTILRSSPIAGPGVQVAHILSICVVVATAVIMDLRVLGLIGQPRAVADMTRRLLPWTWAALTVLLITGFVLVLNRPVRYASNVAFQLKLVLLCLAVPLTLYFQLASRGDAGFWERTDGHRHAAKVVAGLSLIVWLGLIFAGRWIAYAPR